MYAVQCTDITDTIPQIFIFKSNALCKNMQYIEIT